MAWYRHRYRLGTVSGQAKLSVRPVKLSVRPGQAKLSVRPGQARYSVRPG